MHSTTIILIAFGLLATVAMARPGKRPSSGHHHHGHGGNGHLGHKRTIFRLPHFIRLPLELAGKLEQPRATFTVKKIFDGKYLIITPALIFKIKTDDNETDSTSTAIPETTTLHPTRSTTEEPESQETTTEPEVEETTTTEPEEEETTTEPEVEETSITPEEEEETTTETPSFFRKRSFSLNDNEQLLFLED